MREQSIWALRRTLRLLCATKTVSIRLRLFRSTHRLEMDRLIPMDPLISWMPTAVSFQSERCHFVYTVQYEYQVVYTDTMQSWLLCFVAAGLGIEVYVTPQPHSSSKSGYQQFYEAIATWLLTESHCVAFGSRSRRLLAGHKTCRATLTSSTASFLVPRWA